MTPLLAFAFALVAAQQPEQLSRVEGVVLDSVTRLPVAGANVVAVALLISDTVVDDAIDIGFELREVRADADGKATFTGLLPRTYRVTAYPPNSLWGDDPNLKTRLRAGHEVRVTTGLVALTEVRTQPAP